ncbi:MAG: translocation/assembly module TamB [Verrucomicrobiota bacterium]|nr:translocation/assembly module TamB [Verrucomicrobiota bacterium]
MKKFIFLLLFLGLSAFGLLFLQSPTLHKLLVARLEKSAKSEGWELHVEKSSGLLPLFFNAEGVSLKKPGLQLFVDKCRGEISILSLFKGPFRLINFHIGTITFEFQGESISTSSSTSLIIDHLAIDHLCWDKECVDSLSGSLHLRNSQGKARGSFLWEEKPFAFDGAFKGNFGRIWVDSPWGATTFEIERKENGMLIHGEGAELQLTLPHFSLSFRSLQAEGNFGKEGIDATVSIGNLHDLPTELYGDLYGSLQGTLRGSLESGFLLEGEAADIYWRDLSCKSCAFRFDPNQKVRLQARDLLWHTLQLQDALLEAEKKEAWQFQCAASGDWLRPIEFQCSGEITSQYTGTLTTFSGTFYNHPFSLQKPLFFSPEHLGPLFLTVGEGELLGEFIQKKEDGSLVLSLKNFPLDLLSLNPLEVPISGLVDASLSLASHSSLVTGTAEMELRQVEAGAFRTAGHLTGLLTDNLFTLSGHLGTLSHPLVQINLSLPLHLLYPFHIAWISGAPLEGQLAYSGTVEEVLDFANLGMHHLKGEIMCDLSLSGTLEHPEVKGACHLQKGQYENYLTGVTLADLDLELKGEGAQMELNLFAFDLLHLGTLQAKGIMQLEQLFPFQIEAVIDDFALTQIDLVQASANGALTLSGNIQGAHLSGSIDLQKTELHIPSHIPKPIPELSVVYRNATQPVAAPPRPMPPSWPISLDLTVKTPEGISIDGRGLSSEWNGDFHLGGTYLHFLTEGKLELLQGEFIFAGKTFALTQGSLSFRGKAHEVPFLHLAGVIHVKDVEISVTLKGPLNRPQVTLTSSPPLPMSSIVSYLLFGQELSELNSFQALQLVATIASVAGEGPDVMEETRRALGVDRLEIVSLPGNEENITSAIAVQVGKYVGENVLISYTQNAEFAAGNISIQIELPHGLTIQLDNDQIMEQGKFALQWNYNY